MVKPNRKDWSHCLDDALWAHKIAYKAPIEISSFRIIFSKTCHLPMKTVDKHTELKLSIWI